LTRAAAAVLSDARDPGRGRTLDARSAGPAHLRVVLRS
jgi:hypothetical protein